MNTDFRTNFEHYKNTSNMLNWTHLQLCKKVIQISSQLIFWMLINLQFRSSKREMADWIKSALLGYNNRDEIMSFLGLSRQRTWGKIAQGILSQQLRFPVNWNSNAAHSVNNLKGNSSIIARITATYFLRSLPSPCLSCRVDDFPVSLSIFCALTD